MADYPGYDAFCRYCGRPIIFIRTTNGKLMPCDAEPVPYWLSDGHRGVMVYQRNGTYARALLDGLPSLRSGHGYRPHWPGCSGRKKRGGTEPEPERETPARRQLRERIEKERAAKAEREAKEAEKRAAEALRREAEERQCRLF